MPTDCPQRDERLGWTGDAETFVRAATYNADVAAFFTKWLVDLEDAQGPAGDFPDVAPKNPITGGGTAAWADAGTDLSLDDLSGLQRQAALGKALRRDGSLGRVLPEEQQGPAASGGRLRRLAFDQRQHADRGSGDRLFRPEHAAHRRCRPRARQGGRRPQVRRVVPADQSGVQQGVRRARWANEGQHADLLRAGLVRSTCCRRKSVPPPLAIWSTTSSRAARIFRPASWAQAR